MKVHIYGEINHPWRNYRCPACGIALSDSDRVVLTHTESNGFAYMIIVHENCYDEKEGVKWQDIKLDDTAPL